jgi:hypothetical protein
MENEDLHAFAEAFLTFLDFFLPVPLHLLGVLKLDFFPLRLLSALKPASTRWTKRKISRSVGTTRLDADFQSRKQIGIVWVVMLASANLRLDDLSLLFRMYLPWLIAKRGVMRKEKSKRTM